MKSLVPRWSGLRHLGVKELRGSEEHHIANAKCNENLLVLLLIPEKRLAPARFPEFEFASCKTETPRTCTTIT